MLSALGRIRELRVTPRLAVLAIGTAVALGVLVIALLQGDLPDAVVDGTGWAMRQLRGHGYLTSYPLLYIEESGVPLFAPGDVFMLYVGAHVPPNALALVAAWLGFVVVIVLGSTNLYLISRRVGRNIADWRVAGYVHLTHERLDRAERWFQRYGPIAIIFGRHVPGLRVPITVASGVLHVRYPVFAGCVAISSAVWAGFWVALGALYGLRVEAFLNSHRWAFWAIGTVIALAIAVYVVRRYLQLRQPAAAR